VTDLGSEQKACEEKVNGKAEDKLGMKATP